MSLGPEHANPYLTALERLIGRRMLRPNEAARRLRQKVRTMRARAKERDRRRMDKETRAFAMAEREAARREELARARATPLPSETAQSSPESGQANPLLEQYRLELENQIMDGKRRA